MALSPWTSGPWWQQPQEDPNRWWQTPVSPITSALSPSKSAAEETADLLKRYREALAGSTSEAPADVMKDARKAGLAQSLIALGAGIAHGDWTGGIQAGSQALTQGYDQTIQRWAKTRDQNFEKQQAELQMSLKEAELRRQAEDDREMRDRADRLRRDHPEYASFSDKALSGAETNLLQIAASQAAKADDWKKIGSGTTLDGRPAFLQTDPEGKKSRVVVVGPDGLFQEIDPEELDPKTTDSWRRTMQERSDARAQAGLGLRYQANDRQNQANDRANALFPAALAGADEKLGGIARGQEIAKEVGAPPGLSKAAQKAWDEVASEYDMMVFKSGQFMSGVPVSTIADGSHVKQGENGEVLIGGVAIPASPDGKVDLASITPEQAYQVKLAMTANRLKAGGGATIVTKPNPRATPTVGGMDSNTIGNLGGSAITAVGLKQSTDASTTAKVQAAVATATAEAAAFRDKGRKTRAFADALSRAGLSPDEIAAAVASYVP